MTHQPSPAATLQKTGPLTFGIDRLSRDIRAALLTRAGGVVLATATVLGLATLPLLAQAGDFQVTKLTDTADGTCDADCSLREAVAAANALDNGPATVNVISFASGLVGTLTLDIASFGNIDIHDELAIVGPGSDQVVIDAAGVASTAGYGGIFHASDATSLSTISGVTLSGGASEQGGAIYAYYDLALEAVSVRDCEADAGGGFFVRRGNANLIDSVVGNNTATEYGGGFLVDGEVSLTRSTVSGNTAGFDGGGFWARENATLHGSTISGNLANYDGGGFYVQLGGATLLDSVVSDNTATVSDGGGFALKGFGGASLSGSTVSGNAAGGRGGGFIAVGFGEAELANSTVSGNSAQIDGGGLHVSYSAILVSSTVSDNDTMGVGGGVHVEESGGVSLRNSIVAGNAAVADPDDPDVHLENGILQADFSLLGISATAIIGGNNLVGNAAAPLDPRLGPLQANGGPTPTHALDANSPGRDAGNNALAAGLDYDQRGPGYPRIVSGTVDMGAFERSDRIFFDGFE